MSQVTLEIQSKQVPIGLTTFGIPGVFDVGFHQYVALVQTTYNASGQILSVETLSSIHGLPTVASNPTPVDQLPNNTVTAAPGLNSNLYVYTVPQDYLINGVHNQTLVSTGVIEAGSPEYSEVYDNFFTAGGEAEAALNGLDMRYNIFRQNSNSVARWVVDRLSDMFGFENQIDPGIDLMSPGWENPLEDPLTEAELPRGEPFPPNYCFPASTPISLADGHTKPIDAVRSGDRIRAFNDGRLGDAVACR